MQQMIKHKISDEEYNELINKQGELIVKPLEKRAGLCMTWDKDKNDFSFAMWGKTQDLVVLILEMDAIIPVEIKDLLREYWSKDESGSGSVEAEAQANSRIYHYSYPVDEKSFDYTIGLTVCKRKIMQKLWEICGQYSLITGKKL